MPSPLRKKDNSPNSSNIAYTRWEAVESDEHASLQIPFSEFEEEPPDEQEQQQSQNFNNSRKKLQAVALLSGSRLKSAFVSSSNNNNNNQAKQQQQRQHNSPPSPTFRVTESQLLSFAARVLIVLIIFGLGWIFGFLVRWGIHTYYVDPLGHCMTPAPYHYNPSMAKWAMDEVNYTNIRGFFDEFTSSEHHRPGTLESKKFSTYVKESWIDFGLQKVEIEEVDVARLPDATSKRKEIAIRDEYGRLVDRIALTAENSAEVSYSASAIAKGRLVYAHFGRADDFVALSSSINFTSSVALIRLGRGEDAVSAANAARNARHFGASAVILFPDPLDYANLVDDDTALARSAKVRPGDPDSPYFVDGSALPDIPVVSVTPRLAMRLVVNYTMAKDVPVLMRSGLPLEINKERNFEVTVEVEVNAKPAKLFNVIGSIPGRYEPTRYVLIGSHHDTWDRGSGKPANSHSVLMEMTRVLGSLFQHGWRPGRSLLFASWDGEEAGKLGSAAWMNRHAKELQARAVAYVNLDHRGDSQTQVEGSALFSDIIKLAADSVPSEHIGSGEVGESHTVFDDWLDTEQRRTGKREWRLPPTSSPFQTILGVSTVDVSLKNLDAKKMLPSPIEMQSQRHVGGGRALVEQAKQFLDRQHLYSAKIARFALVLAMRLVSSPDVPLSASAYARRIHDDAHALQARAQSWKKSGDLGTELEMEDISKAMIKLDKAAERFHLTYDGNGGALELLGHHEFSDQMIEMERSMLINVWGENSNSKCPHTLMASSPDRHAIYGPSPLDGGAAVAFPRLNSAVRMALAMRGREEGQEKVLWECARREMFFIVDALDSATCVLDNHLVYTYPGEGGH